MDPRRRLSHGLGDGIIPALIIIAGLILAELVRRVLS